MKTRLKPITIALALLAIVLVACAPQPAALPNTGGQETPATGHPVLQPVQKAQAWLVKQLGVPADQVKVASFGPAEWTDSCLGLGGPAESCLQAITPGYQITLTANGQSYEVRTDATGEVIRSPQFPYKP